MRAFRKHNMKRRSCAPRWRRLIVEQFEPRQMLNAAPGGTNGTISGLEDTAYVFSAADFGFSDPQDNPPHNFIGVRVASLPTRGTLADNNIALAPGQFVPLANIGAGKLNYMPATDANGLGYASFTFQVRDSGGFSAGGFDLDPTPKTLAIDIASVNDAPRGSTLSKRILQDTTLTFSPGDFSFSDPHDNPANQLFAVKFGLDTRLPDEAMLFYSGGPVMPGTIIPVSELDTLIYTPPPHSTAYATFSFQVIDDGGTANGGTNVESFWQYGSISITPVHHAPTGTSTTVSAIEDIAYVFNTADFPFLDPIDRSDNLAAVLITSVPPLAAGTLRNNGVPVIAGQFVPVQDFTNQHVTFVPAPHVWGQTSFTFQVQDNGGTANGSQDLDPVPKTLTINITESNNPPAGVDSHVTTREDVPYTFQPADFPFADLDLPPNLLKSVKIVTLPLAGSLLNGGAAVPAGAAVSAEDIEAGKLTFVPAASANGLPYARFVFQIQDDGGTSWRGIDVDPTPRTMTVGVSAVNDPPLGADRTINVVTNLARVLGVSDFPFVDQDDLAPRNPSGANSLLTVLIEGLNLGGAGTLNYRGANVTAPLTVSASDILAGQLVFAAEPAAGVQASIRFQIQDNGGTAGGGADTDDSPRTLTLLVGDLAEHHPQGSDRSVTAFKNVPYAFRAEDFGFSDSTNPSHNFLTLKISSLPPGGVLVNRGAAVSAGTFVTVNDIQNRLFKFTPFIPNVIGSPFSSFTFQVQDDGGTASGQTDLDPSPNTLTINIASVNQSPVGADFTKSGIEKQPIAFAASDFGFTDPSDALSNNFKAVTIYTVPGRGYLKLGSTYLFNTPVTIPFASLGTLVFTTYCCRDWEWGIPYTKFDFAVQDDGGTANGGVDVDPELKTATISLTAVNDAPRTRDATVSAQPYTTYTFALSDFPLDDYFDQPLLGSGPPNTLQAVQITQLPTSGSLTLFNGSSNVPAAAEQFVSAVDIAAGKLRFTATSYPSYYFPSFQFKVQDNGGTANGGSDLSSSATMSIITYVVGGPASGQDQTITLLENSSYTFSVSDFGFINPNNIPPHSFVAVKITTTPLIGTLSYSGYPVTDGQFIPVSALQGLKYTPPPNTAGPSPVPAPPGTNPPPDTNPPPSHGGVDPAWTLTKFTFQVQDNGGTFNGRSDLDPFPKTMTLRVLPVNKPPVGSYGTTTTNEDTPYTIGISDFGFTDPYDNPPKNLLAVKITALPTAGVLTAGGVPVAAGDIVAAVDIGSGQLVFTPAVNANGAHYATIQFQVRDDGGTANGGGDLDLLARTLTIHVAAVNDPPLGGSRALKLPPTTSRTLTATDFGYRDPHDSPQNGLLAVTISSLPSQGTLTLAGNAFTAPVVLPATALALGQLVYTAPTTAVPLDVLFTFQVQDDGGTASGGVDLDPIPRKLTLHVASGTNHAPRGADNIITTREDAAYMFQASDFLLNDLSDSPPNNLLAIKISALPAISAGMLSDNGVPVTLGQFIPWIDLATGHFTFAPAANQNGSSFASFQYQIQDDGGTAEGGINLDPTPCTVAIRVLPVNDPPQSPVTSVTTLEDQSYTFQVADFGFSDPNDSPSNSLLAVILDELPVTVGTLKLNGSAVRMSQTVLASSIAEGQLVFTPIANANGLATFTYRLQDTGGTASRGSDTMPNPSYMAIHVLSVNDAPTRQTYDHVTTKDDVPYTFQPSDFSYFDFSDSPANRLNGVIIASLPPQGTLFLAGTAVTVNQLIPVSAIQAGQFAYVPRADVNVQNSTITSFKLRIQDDGGTANGGNDTDPVTSTMEVNVQWINHPPTGANRTVSVFQNTSRTLTRSDFDYSDPLDQPQNAMRSVKINSLPTLGTLTLSGLGLVTAGQVVSAGDIDAGKLLYAAPVTATPLNDPLTFQVQDAGGTGTGGLDTDPTPKTMTLRVTNVANHSPSATNGYVTTAENVAYIFQAADFGFSDPNDSPRNNLLAVQVALPAVGILKLYGSVLTVGKVIPAVDIVTGKLTYTAPPNRFGTNLASFQFTAQDDGGRASGAYDYAPTRTMTISVLHANHAPSGATSFPTTNEDAPYVVKVSDFRFTDANDSPANAFQSIVVATPILRGTLTVSGSPAVPGQTIPLSEIAAGHVLLHPAPNSDDFVYFSFRVQDNGGTANGGIDTDPISYPPSLDLLITPINDAPAGIDKIVTIKEDASYNFQTADFGFGDSLDPTPNNLKAVKITTTPVAGTLTINGVPVSAGTFVSSTDINAGRLIFIPSPNSHGLPYAAFTFQVQDDGGISLGGMDLDPTPNTLTINVTPVNDPPSGADRIVSTLEDVPYVFAAPDFGFTDLLDSPTNNFQAVQIFTLHETGTLTYGGVPVASGQLIPVSDILAGQLRFVPPFGNGIGLATYAILVKDDGGTADGGIDLAGASSFITIDVVHCSLKPPIGQDKTVFTREDQPFVLWYTDFGLEDPFDLPNETPQSVTIIAPPAAGRLTYNGVEISPGQSVLISDIVAGLLQFQPAANASGIAYASFEYQVVDGSVFSICGEPSTFTITIDILSVNDPPSFLPIFVPPVSDESGLMSIVVQTTVGPPDEAGQKVTQVFVVGNSNLDIFLEPPRFDANSNLIFKPMPNVMGTAEITVGLKDDGGTANGGKDTSALQTLTIQVFKARAWYNAAKALDVSGDGFIVAGDALDVINLLNAFGPQLVPDDGRAEGPFYDCNGDGFVTASDALEVIDQLNAFGPDVEGEPSRSQTQGSLAEGESTSTENGQHLSLDELVTLLGLDVALQSRRQR